MPSRANKNMDQSIPPKGVVLKLSCRKFAATRIPTTKLRQADLPEGWMLVHVIADPSADFKDRHLFTKMPPLSDNLLILGCEDSYIHLLKKLVRAMEAIWERWGVPRWGVVRTSEVEFVDLPLFRMFLREMQFQAEALDPRACARVFGDRVVPSLNPPPQVNSLFLYQDTFMQEYYSRNLDEMREYGMTLEQIREMGEKHSGANPGVVGKIMYLTVGACEVLMEEFRAVNCDVFASFGGVYPFFIEDNAISVIMLRWGVPIVHSEMLLRCVRYIHGASCGASGGARQNPHPESG